MGLLAGLLALVVAGPASADMLLFDTGVNPDRGHTPISELSYEVIVDGQDGYRADVRVRVALKNDSLRPQDVVLNMALPRGSVIEGLRVARNGNWTLGKTTKRATGRHGRRRPGTFFAHYLAPKLPGDLPGAQLVGFALDPGSTTQVELSLKVAPEIRGTHWELALPGRGDKSLGLAKTRRVVVRTKQFWVDGQANAGKPMLESPADDGVRVTWNVARTGKPQPRRPLHADLETLASPDQKGGTFRMYLQPGVAKTMRPDHVVVVLDRSRSTAPAFHRAAVELLEKLGQQLPATTFDVVSFARTATAVMGEEPPRRWPTLRQQDKIATVAQALDQGFQQQGTNIAAALSLTATRLKSRAAKRPLVIVLTDGMMPVSTAPKKVQQQLNQVLGRRAAPEILFLVDEPLLQTSTLDADHPIAKLASVLKARIRLQSLASNYLDIRALLTAPAVISDIKAIVPRSVALTGPVPTGLVAGSVTVVEGSYRGRRPPQIQLRGRARGRTVATTAKLHTQVRPKPAWAATTQVAELANAIQDGLVLPPWYSRNQHHRAMLSIINAGRGGLQRRGFLDERIFRNYLGTRVYPRAQACYNRALARNQFLSGRVVIEVEVGKGEVMHASLAQTQLNRDDGEFLHCLGEAAWALEIPAGEADLEIYRVRYPLVFHSPKSGRSRIERDPLGEGTFERLLSGPEGDG